jgi:hypothetical protein
VHAARAAAGIAPNPVDSARALRALNEIESRFQFQKKGGRMDSSCQSHRELIAQGPFCSIEECTCGTLHVTFGALTIRVSPGVLESMWATFGEAMLRMGRGDEVRSHEPARVRGRIAKLAS